MLPVHETEVILMAGFQSQYVTYLKLLQRALEELIFTVERIGHHPKGNAFLYGGPLYKLGGYLELGAEVGVSLAPASK
jgi:hypothetical protein